MKKQLLFLLIISLFSTYIIYSKAHSSNAYILYISDQVNEEVIPILKENVENYQVVNNLSQKNYRVADVTNDILKNKEISIKGDKKTIQYLVNKSQMIVLDVGANEINNLKLLEYDSSFIINKIIDDYSNLIKEINKYYTKSLVIKPMASDYEEINIEINDFFKRLSLDNDTIIFYK